MTTTTVNKPLSQKVLKSKMKFRLYGKKNKKGLTRIQALRDIPRCKVKKGNLGGWVLKESNLSQKGDAWIGEEAQVYEDALISGYTKIFEHACVYGNAHIYGDTQVSGHARVFENAQVYGNARVFGNALIYGHACVYGDVRVYEDIRVYGSARVFDNAEIYGDAWVSGYAHISEHAHISDNALVYDNARVFGSTWISGDAHIRGDALVSGDAQIFGGTWEKSPLSIQGTRDALTTSSHTEITVGCVTFTVEEWLKNYKEIGKENDYSDEEIEEYFSLIKTAEKWLQKV